MAPNASQGLFQVNKALGTSVDSAIRITDNATTSMMLNNISSGISAIWSSGSIAFGVGSNSLSEAMRLTSTGLGIGTSSPIAKLDVRGNLNLGDGTSNSNITNTVDTAFMLISGGTSTQNNIRLYGPSHPTLANVQTFITNGSERMRLDSSGNLGLGVTPSAWQSPFVAFQISTGGAALTGRTDGGQVNLSSNWRYGSGTNLYINNGFASRYAQESGGHYWYTAPSGTAGNAISFTQAMTLDADGDLGVGTTSPATKFVVSNAGAQGLEFNPNSSGLGMLEAYNRSTSAYYGFRINADDIRFHTGASATERARITSAGAWSFGSSGTATGTSGQVLTSNGSGSAPTWQTAGGGNWVLIQTNTFSGATTIDMTGMSSTYDLYFIEGVITGTTGSFFAPGWRLINSSSTVLTSSLYCGNLWGGEENTTNVRWYTDENAGRFLSSAAYYTTNIDISFNMYVNRSPNNEYQGVWGNTMSLYSTFPSPSWFSGGYRALVNLNGIRIFDTTSAWTATGTLRLWGWKKT
jgi:hypothetical protein